MGLTRPPIAEAEHVERARDANGHVWQFVGNWIYPCLGCGHDNRYAGLGLLPCVSPYSDPKGVEALLTQILGVLTEIRDRLPAPVAPRPPRNRGLPTLPKAPE